MSGNDLSDAAKVIAYTLDLGLVSEPRIVIALEALVSSGWTITAPVVYDEPKPLTGREYVDWFLFVQVTFDDPEDVVKHLPDEKLLDFFNYAPIDTCRGPFEWAMEELERRGVLSD